MKVASWAYLTRVQTIAERIPAGCPFPYSLPFVRTLDLTFTKPVTFFVGENGTGKSTLREAIAALCRLPVSGGGKSELADRHGPERGSELSNALRPTFHRHPQDGYFLRAEFHAHFATLLDERKADPDFIGDPFLRYGGRSLHTRSHGESFLSVLQNRVRGGVYLLDEPESALSPQRQLALLILMDELVRAGKTQFVIATHSPILLTFPGARIVCFDDPALCSITLKETSHYQITRGILETPELYWKALRED